MRSVVVKAGMVGDEMEVVRKGREHTYISMDIAALTLDVKQVKGLWFWHVAVQRGQLVRRAISMACPRPELVPPSGSDPYPLTVSRPQ